MNLLVTPAQYVVSWRHDAVSYAQCFCCPVTVTCVAGVVNRLRVLDDPGFISRQVLEIFYFSKTRRSALGPKKPPIQWVTELYPGVKQLWRKADHLSQYIAKDKNKWSYTFALL
jgi:hypothetical protein